MSEHLLYVSPVQPASTGNGLAMRAGTVLCALAERYRVSLLVIELYAPAEPAIPEQIARRCQQIVIARPGETVPTPWPGASLGSARRSGLLGRLARLAAGAARSEQPPLPAPQFRDEPFNVVHLFRLATLPLVDPWLQANFGRPRRHLDLDDLESATWRRLASLYRLNGDHEQADREQAEADHHAALEQEALRNFDRVYVCSEEDRARLAPSALAELAVLPNAVDVPEPLPPAPTDRPFTFLFVGTLGYYPNEDAVLFFCREVVPRLRVRTPGAFRLAIVGVGVTSAIARLADAPDVEVVGQVPDMRPWYQQAGALVVPLRAGGGTRIKILEAFSYRRPVVSTSIGAEGIAARPDEHLLIADGADAFAAQCARLMADPTLGASLAERAYALYASRYTPDALARIVHALA